MNMFEQIKTEAFEDELKKIAGEASEAFGSLTSIPFGGTGLLAMGLGALSGPKNKEEMEIQNKKSVSNVLLPWLGAYRMGRRIRTGLAQKTDTNTTKELQDLKDELQKMKEKNG